MYRIGFDAKRAFNNLRGLGSYSRNLIDGLITFNPENEYFLYGSRPTNPSCRQWLESLENKVTTVSSVSKTKIGRAIWRSAGMTNSIREDKLNIYHGLSHEIPYGSRAIKSRFVVTIHDLIFLYYKENFSYFDREIYLSKINRSCRNSDKIIAISEQTKSDLVNLIGVDSDKITVNYQSCSPLFYAKSGEEKKREVRDKYQLPDEYFLFVGALVKHKNIINIVDSISILPEEYKLPLIIVGRGKEYKQEILKRAKQKGLGEKVTIIDYVDTEDMPSIYQLAKVLIWPSLYEGFGIPIIEALFSGLPVITSRTGCFREAAGKGSCYIDPNSIEEISESIVSIMSDSIKYQNMQDEGYQHVQKFHIKRTTQELMNFYNSMF